MKSKKLNNFDDDFMNFYKKYFPELLQFVSKKYNDTIGAADIVNDVFLKIYKKGQMPKCTENKINAYLKKAAKNMITDYWRKQQREETKLERMISNFDIESDPVETSFLNGEMLSTLNDLLSEFPENHKNIFLDKFLHNKSLSTIAKSNNTTPYIIKKIITKISNKIKEKLFMYLE